MNRWKRSAFLVLCAALILLSISACTPAGNDPSAASTGAASTAAPATSAPAQTATTAPEPEGFRAPDHDNVNLDGSFPLLKETVPLLLGISQHPLVEDYETNRFTLFLEEMVNVDLKFDYYLAADAESKVRILISSGTKLPDIITGFTFSDLDILSYGSQGAIIPLNDYIDTYSTNIIAAYEETPLYKQAMTAPDGSMYAMPQIWEQTREEWGCLAWINQTWLDRVGKTVPTTTQEFYEALKAFKIGDPNGNGRDDDIPFIGSSTTMGYDFIINAFTYYPADRVKNIGVNDGILYPAYTTDEWRDALIYLNMLCQEDLYSPITFTQDNATYQAMLRNLDHSLVGVSVGSANNMNTPETRLLEYVDLPPLTGPNGEKWSTFTPAVPISRYVITKDCETPAAAFILADFMLAPENAYFSRYGEPGVDWVDPEPGEEGYLSDMGFPATVKPILIWGTVQNSHWQQGNPSYGKYDAGNGQVWDGNPANGPYYNHMAVYSRIGLVPEEIVYKFIYTSQEADEMKDLDSTINNYVKESTARFITGDLDISGSDWDSYLKELSNMALERYMQINQAAYDRMQGE
ncbi:MAG: hypothetical protein ACOX8S_05030 [Christensenellales bacterium]